jgi:hypothetical protein
MRTRGPFRLIAAVMAFFTLASLVSAHSVAVNLSILSQNKHIVVLASSLDGYPIQGAIIEYQLIAEDGTTYRAPLKERAESEYATPEPAAKAGTYTLLIRDSTFPRETLEVKKVVSWPLTSAVQLVLPPNTPEGPNPAVVFGLIGLPVVLAFLVLLWAIARRKNNPEPEAELEAPNVRGT